MEKKLKLNVFVCRFKKLKMYKYLVLICILSVLVDAGYKTQFSFLPNGCDDLYKEIALEQEFEFEKFEQAKEEVEHRLNNYRPECYGGAIISKGQDTLILVFRNIPQCCYHQNCTMTVSTISGNVFMTDKLELPNYGYAYDD